MLLRPLAVTPAPFLIDQQTSIMAAATAATAALNMMDKRVVILLLSLACMCLSAPPPSMNAGKQATNAADIQAQHSTQTEQLSRGDKLALYNLVSNLIDQDLDEDSLALMGAGEEEAMMDKRSGLKKRYSMGKHFKGRILSRLRNLLQSTVPRAQEQAYNTYEIPDDFLLSLK